ncbi:restriction endonuclease subunit S [Rhizobium leguminosarum]|uniref:restriction endonuclease subunit S n=1 Tax=Rhizobium leguminosarum TaxID=384 RepID=UPI001FDFDA86|nr:restriction endonuclease subunit S [Rhizobium leguminosarum]
MQSSIPLGWQELRIGQIAREISQRNRNSADIPVLSVTKHNGFVRSSEYFTRSVHSDDTSNYKIVRKGQFAYATIHLDEGSIALLKDFEHGLISPMYTVFEASSALVCSDYLFLCLKRFALSGRFDPYSNGGVNRRKSISFGDLKAFRFALPPLTEQRAIVEVLGAMEEAITKSEALIGELSAGKGHILKLYEAESASAPKMKLRSMVKSLTAGVSVGGEARGKYDHEFGVLRTSSVSSGIFLPDQLKVISEDNLDRVATNPKADCIIISRANTPELVGASAYVRENHNNVFLSDKLWQIDIRDRKSVNVRWLSLVLGTPRMRKMMSVRANGTSSSMQNISKSAFLGLEVSVPAIKVQNAIADAADVFETRQLQEQSYLNALKSTRAALAQELLSGRLRLPESMIARHREKSERAA